MGRTWGLDQGEEAPEQEPVDENLREVLGEVMSCLEGIESAEPDYPTDPIHATAEIVEAAGLLQKAALDATYGNENPKKVYEATVVSMATALRFLLNFENMEPRPSPVIT
jgi:hypothetical protein